MLVDQCSLYVADIFVLPQNPTIPNIWTCKFELYACTCVMMCINSTHLELYVLKSLNQCVNLIIPIEEE